MPDPSSTPPKLAPLWRDKPLHVRARCVPRYFWTTSSIDVFLDGQCILSTGGQLKLTGSYSSNFHYAGADHVAELSWGTSSWFGFPYQLKIDGAPVADSRVQIENPLMIFIPASVLVAIVLAILLAIGWSITKPQSQPLKPEDDTSLLNTFQQRA